MSVQNFYLFMVCAYLLCATTRIITSQKVRSSLLKKYTVGDIVFGVVLSGLIWPIVVGLWVKGFIKGVKK